METRFTEIERENRILLEKMTSIMHANQKGLPLASLKPPTTSCKYNLYSC